MAGAHAAREDTIPAHTWASRLVDGRLSSEKAQILPSFGFMKMNPLSLSLSADILQPPNSMQVEKELGIRWDMSEDLTITFSGIDWPFNGTI